MPMPRGVRNIDRETEIFVYTLNKAPERAHPILSYGVSSARMLSTRVNYARAGLNAWGPRPPRNTCGLRVRRVFEPRRAARGDNDLTPPARTGSGC